MYRILTVLILSRHDLRCCRLLKQVHLALTMLFCRTLHCYYVPQSCAAYYCTASRTMCRADAMLASCVAAASTRRRGKPYLSLPTSLGVSRGALSCSFCRFGEPSRWSHSTAGGLFHAEANQPKCLCCNQCGCSSGSLTAKWSPDTMRHRNPKPSISCSTCSNILH